MGIFSLSRKDYKSATLTYKGKKFKAYVADSFRKKSKGLMGWKKLGSNMGMLFIFDKDGRHGIWMKSMRFSIDIVWLDKDKKIVDIFQRARPCVSIFNCPVYRPGEKARYVLEFDEGTVNKHGIRIGEKILINV